MKRQEMVEPYGKMLHQTAAGLGAPLSLLCAKAARPELLTVATADPCAAPAATGTRPPRPRHLWGRNDGFTMAGARR